MICTGLSPPMKIYFYVSEVVVLDLKAFKFRAAFCEK